MFQFPRLPLMRLYIQRIVTRHDPSRVSPFGHLRIKACLSAPRSLSQTATSFIGVLCQGIHRVPLSNFLRFRNVWPFYLPAGRAGCTVKLLAYHCVELCEAPSEYVSTPQYTSRILLVLHPSQSLRIYLFQIVLHECSARKMCGARTNCTVKYRE